MNAEPSLVGYRLDHVATDPAGRDRVDTPTAPAAYFEQVRAHRSELRESVAAVGLALESPTARGGAWRERVRAALAELAHDFADHIALTESPGGIYDLAKDTAPRLSVAVDRLLAQHRDYRDAIGGYLAVLEHGGTLADLPAFREELTTLVGRLVRHRRAGGPTSCTRPTRSTSVGLTDPGPRGRAPALAELRDQGRLEQWTQGETGVTLGARARGEHLMQLDLVALEANP